MRILSAYEQIPCFLLKMLSVKCKVKERQRLIIASQTRKAITSWASLLFSNASKLGFTYYVHFVLKSVINNILLLLFLFFILYIIVVTKSTCGRNAGSRGLSKESLYTSGYPDTEFIQLMKSNEQASPCVRRNLQWRIRYIQPVFKGCGTQWWNPFHHLLGLV